MFNLCTVILQLLLVIEWAIFETASETYILHKALASGHVPLPLCAEVIIHTVSVNDSVTFTDSSDRERGQL